MEYFLFAGYLLLFAWLVTRLGFFKKSGLSNAQLVILLLLKIMMGIFYGWIGIYYGQFAYMYDTWSYHHTSIEEYHLLLNDPSAYFSGFFHSGYENKYGGFFASENSWWNDLKSNLFVKILSIFNLFSFGNYYINVIFYSFITLAGPVALYRVFKDVFPGKRIEVLIATFIIPSFIYWTSGIHKDGLVSMAISVIVYHVYFGLKEDQFRLKRIVPVIFSLLIILAFRNFLLLILIPAILTWCLAYKYKKRSLAIYLAAYFVFGLIFFNARYIIPGLDFPNAVAEKQKAFKSLQGNSGIELKELEPSFISFLSNSPQALVSTTLRPHPGDVRHILSMAAATENVLFIILFLLFFFLRANSISSKPFLLFCLFFSFSLLLTIGYTVNFLGAIVRYRSIVLPFLIIPVVALINWNKISKFLFNNIKNNHNV